jgi:acetoin utilization protein AcuB
MFVGNSMVKKVVTADPDNSIIEVREKLALHKIRHLPVVAEGNRLIGMVTDRDIRSAMPSNLAEGCDLDEKALTRLKIKDFMTRDVVTISMMDTIQDALLLFQQKKVGALPVVDEKSILQGIVSVRDLLQSFVNVLGIGEPGVLLGIVVEEKVGQLKKIVDAITEENVSLGSILVSRYWEEDKRAVFPYLLTNNPARIKKKLERLGYTLINPMDWCLDHNTHSE